MAVRRLTGASPRALLLDAAGTLVGLEPPVPLLVALLAQRFGLAVTEAQADAALAAEVVYYRAHMQEGKDARSLAELHARCAGVLFASLPDPGQRARIGTEAQVGVLLDVLRFHVFPEVPAVLRALRGAGLRLVVASNWDCSLTGVLERLGLLSAVDGVVTSAVLGVAKPDPRLLLEAARVAGVEPAAAVHVGDSVGEDLGAARAAGIRAVLVRRDGGASSELGVPVIDSLRGLPEVMCISSLPDVD